VSQNLMIPKNVAFSASPIGSRVPVSSHLSFAGFKSHGKQEQVT